jgi:hypothetical protein
VLAVEPRYPLALDFSEGLAPVEVGSKWGYIDKAGRTVIPPQFYSAYEFRHGLGLVNTAEGAGYIDKTGKYVWPPSK